MHYQSLMPIFAKIISVFAPYLNSKGCEKMILVDVRIKNYKCILDSETFSIDQLTCLVGKNESGKSAILQALYKLNPVDKEDTYDALYEYPKMYQTDFEAGFIDDGDTVVISNWKFTTEEIRFLYKGIIINHNKKLSQPTLKRRFFKKKAAFFSWLGLGKEWC